MEDMNLNLSFDLPSAGSTDGDETKLKLPVGPQELRATKDITLMNTANGDGNQDQRLTAVKEPVGVSILMNAMPEPNSMIDQTKVKSTCVPEDENNAISSEDEQNRESRHWTKFDDVNHDETEVKVVECKIRNNLDTAAPDSQTHVKCPEEQHSARPINEHIDRSGWVEFEQSDASGERDLVSQSQTGSTLSESPHQGQATMESMEQDLNVFSSPDDSLPNYSDLGLSHTELKQVSSQAVLVVSPIDATPERVQPISSVTQAPAPVPCRSLDHFTPQETMPNISGTLCSGRNEETINGSTNDVDCAPSQPPSYTTVALSDGQRDNKYWTVLPLNQHADAVERLGNSDTGPLIDNEVEFEYCGAPKWAIAVASILTICIIISVVVVLVFYLH